MAYAALISLEHTIEHLLNSSEIPLVASCPEIIQLAYQDVKSLQQIFRALEVDINSKVLKAMESEIREAAFRLEDVLESSSSSALHLSSSPHDLSQSEIPDGGVFLADKVREEIEFFTGSVKKTLEEHYERVDQLPLEEDGTSETGDEFDGNDQSKMVGLEFEVSGSIICSSTGCRRS
ncbi:UNVERIFIED_CONTAM: hypothetical protein Sangu_0545200 [Sesamum angustifolium]|uniref:Uncharacterized protein n=1 Tax=Sesamum angustifolium TaxID=2727405 RepID=A0AAW2Q9Q4_9LAMI